MPEQITDPKPNGNLKVTDVQAMSLTKTRLQANVLNLLRNGMPSGRMHDQPQSLRVGK